MIPPTIPADKVDALVPAGTVVLLLSFDSARDTAAERAIDLCRRWAAAGRRIVLADLHLDQPLLQVGGPDDAVEGIVDVFLYGASLSRIAKPSAEGTFYVIPAGTYAPSSEEIYKHPRWRKVVAGFQDTGATLLLFVSGDDGPSLRDLAIWGSEAIALTRPAGEGAYAALAEVGVDVVGVVDGGEGEPMPQAETAEVQSGEASSSGIDPEAVASRTSPPPPAVAGVRSERMVDDLELPPPPARPRGRKRRSLLLALLVLGALALTAIYLVAALRPAREDAGSSSERQGGGPASPEGDYLHYSVHVKAFTSLPAARAQLATDQRRLPSVPFFVSPEEIQGVLYYRVMAGFLADTTSAIRLRTRLVEAGSVAEEEATFSLIEYKPLAYDLGEYRTREAAMARADSLLVLAIPSYAASGPYSDGSRRWKLYGGAYRDSSGADGMGDLLRAAGLEADLTIRVGDPSPASE